ncbi:unnamed protein product [Protopolystoma xenopodis]|uniref:Uncharacterized protein n=1 Tax=Protopolystoma xenopodis TaxID=117903 RepID=A0A3S4ZTY6_9PLAT|nr:unnamed protein product [Protopolystoma xenopodis]
MWANWAAKQFRVDSLRQAGRHFELLGHQLLALPSEEWRNLLITTSPVSSLSNSSITSSGNTASATTTSNLGGGGGSSLLSMAPSTQSSTPSSCSSNPKTVSSPASVSALLAFFTHAKRLEKYQVNGPMLEITNDMADNTGPGTFHKV